MQSSILDLESEQEIRSEFEKDASYKKRESELRKSYITSLQIGKYTNANKQFDSILINAGTPRQSPTGQHVFYICGKSQPSGDAFKNFIAYFTAQVDPALSSSFVLVYLNTGLMTHQNLSKFFSAYKDLPVEYFSKLGRFYIIHGNMFIKSWFWFQNGVPVEVLKRKATYISKLQTLVNHDFFYMPQYDQLPKYVKDQDSSHKLLAVFLEEKVATNQDYIGNKNAQLVPIIGINVWEYELNHLGVPICVDMLVSQLADNHKFLELEGIFRKNASQSEEKKVEEILARQQYQKLSNVEDGYALAGIIKKVFDKMPNPLIPFDIYGKLIAKWREVKDGKKQIKMLSKCYKKIPELNYRTFVFIVGFLSTISKYEQVNKMTTYNMAVVFAPCFFRPEKYTLDDFKEQLYYG